MRHRLGSTSRVRTSLPPALTPLRSEPGAVLPEGQEVNVNVRNRLHLFGPTGHPS